MFGCYIINFTIIMENKNILRFLIILSLFFKILSVEPIETTNYVVKNLKDMKSSLFSSLGDGFYYLGKEIIGKDYTIIAFSDLNGDGFTDIITYKSLSSSEYEFYVHQYNKEQLKFEDPKLLFKISEPGVSSLRNLFVGNFYGDKTCYLVSFNLNNNSNKLLHLITNNINSLIGTKKKAHAFEVMYDVIATVIEYNFDSVLLKVNVIAINKKFINTKQFNIIKTIKYWSNVKYFINGVNLVEPVINWIKSYAFLFTHQNGLKISINAYETNSIVSNIIKNVNNIKPTDFFLNVE